MSSNSKIVREEPIFRELERRSRMTPDLDDLLGSEEHLLFVYDNLKFGFLNHKYLSASKYLGRAHSLKKNFQLKQSHSTAVLLETHMAVAPDSPNYLPIVGEVYAVSTHTILEIDCLMNNTQLFTREQTYFLLEEQESPFKLNPNNGVKPPLSRNCFIYIGNPEVWEHAHLTFCTKTIRDRRDYWIWDKTSVGRSLMH